MINLLQIQTDLHGLLMSSPALAQVNIVLERKFITESQVEMDAIWQTVRNGKSGGGILIEQPDIITNSNNVTGPPQNVVLSLVSFQNGDAALEPQTGCGLYAEEIEQFVLDALHLQAIQGLGTIQTDGMISKPTNDFGPINARRMRLLIKPIATNQTPRTAFVQVAIANGQATLTCVTPGAEMFYTLDGSFPSNTLVAIDPLSVQGDNAGVAINPNSIRYLNTGPFAVQSGQVIRAVAYADGFNPGEIIGYNVP